MFFHLCSFPSSLPLPLLTALLLTPTDSHHPFISMLLYLLQTKYTNSLLLTHTSCEQHDVSPQHFFFPTCLYTLLRQRHHICKMCVLFICWLLLLLLVFSACSLFDLALLFCLLVLPVFSSFSSDANTFLIVTILLPFPYSSLPLPSTIAISLSLTRFLSKHTKQNTISLF